MYTGRFSKQPDEQFPIRVGFASRLASGESVDSISVSAVDDEGADAAAVVLSSSVANNVATVNVTGGTTGTNYTITILATTDSSPAAVHEADILMAVTAVT